MYVSAAPTATLLSANSDGSAAFAFAFEAVAVVVRWLDCFFVEAMVAETGGLDWDFIVNNVCLSIVVFAAIDRLRK